MNLIHYGYSSQLVYVPTGEVVREIFDGDITTPPLTGIGPDKNFVWSSIKLYRDLDDPVIR